MKPGTIRSIKRRLRKFIDKGFEGPLDFLVPDIA